MGKKSWFSVVKKAVSPSISKIKKEKRSNKSKSNPKNSWHLSLDACSSQTTETALANPLQQCQSVKEPEFVVPDTEQIKHVDSVTYAAATTVEEDAVSHAGAVANDTQSNSCFLGKTEDVSATKIQAAYRGYKARRVFRSLRAMRRLHLWLQGQAVKRQTTSALVSIQTMGRVQSQVRARKIRMAEVNEALQRQLKQKRQKVQEKQAFDLSPKSKAQVEADLRNKKEAAERREKALAYAFSRQQMWRNSQKSPVADNHFHWGWSWSHQCNTIRPWETGTTSNGGAMGKQVRQQSPPSKALSSGQRLKSPSSKSPTSSRSPTSKAISSRVNTGCLAGLANKRHLVTSSPVILAPRIAVR